VKVEKFIAKYQLANDANYHIISSPVNAQNIQPEFVTDPPDSSTDFYCWDEPSAQWLNSKTTTGSWNTQFQPGDDRTFEPGRGYLTAYPADVIRNFSGAISNSDLEVPVTFTSGDFAGYNLVGNPYVSSLLADIHNWTKINVQNAVWVWDPVSGNYKTWNGLTGTLTAGIIPAMQGFYIKASGPLPTLVIPASSRAHHDQAAYKTAIPLVLKISLSGGGYYDESVLFMSGSHSDPGDTLFNVMKIMGFRDAPQLYFRERSTIFSIFRADTLFENQVIPIGIQKGRADTLKFEFSVTDTFSGKDSFYLEDRIEGKSIELKEGTVYEFVSSQPCENARFLLRYKNVTGTHTQSILNTVRIYSEKGELRIVGLEDFTGCEMLEIFDMAGRRVLERLIPPGNTRVCLNLVPAYYLVCVSAGKAIVSKKLLFIK